jgi:V/A-type H+/Na+-transporting ATPase subunit K
MRRKTAIMLLTAALAVLCAGFGSLDAAYSQETQVGGAGSQGNQAASGDSAQVAQAKPVKSGIATGLIAIGAALAVGMAALGTGLAQSRIGAAGAGTIAEKPESVGSIILLVAIPETMLILGFVVAIVIIFTL